MPMTRKIKSTTIDKIQTTKGEILSYQWDIKSIKHCYLSYDYKNKIYKIRTNTKYSKNQVETFILNNYQKFSHPQQENVDNPQIFGTNITIRYIISNIFSYQFYNDLLYIKLPSFSKKKYYTRKFIEKEYKSYLINRVNELCEATNNRITTVECSWYKNKWGHYNKKDNTISLSYQLLRFDKEIIDSVIYHEIAHMTHFDHSVNFKKLLGYYCPNNKILSSKLNHYSDF